MECKHDVALGCGCTAARSSNSDDALAGLRLQALTHADSRQEDQARAMLPELVAKDDSLTSASRAEAELQNALQQLKATRRAYKLPNACG